MKFNRKGFTLVEIMIVVAIIALLAVIAVPNLIKARKTTQASDCANNRRMISDAIDQWALAKNKSGTDTPTADMEEETGILPYLKGNKWPVCKGGGSQRFQITPFFDLQGGWGRARGGQKGVTWRVC